MRRAARRHARPFDPAYKLLLSHPRIAADLIRLLGHDRIDDLDLDRLERLPAEHVRDNLRLRREDLPWLAPYKQSARRSPGAGVVFQFEYLCLQAPLLGLYFSYSSLCPSAVVR